MARLVFLLASSALVCFAQKPTRGPTSTTAAQPAGVSQQAALTTADVAKHVSPSVVVIQGTTESGEVLGSGFIVSKDGRIVTNLHVIRDMKTASVRLANGDVFDSVSVLAVDERRDLAVVQIAGFNLPALELGDSDVLTVGEPVLAVGSPSGLEGTVTAGILSSVRDSGDGFRVLQTDAAVNPGNSGGPLVNGSGQAIGVISFKLRSAEGLNFGVPINYAQGLLKNLHEPMTLDRMREGLTAPATPESDDLRLKEALHWLRDSLALETFSFVAPIDGETPNVSERTSFEPESCSPTIDTLWRFKMSATQDWSPEVSMYKVRVPLGEIANGSVGRRERLPNITSGDRWAYTVLLHAKEKTVVVLQPPNSPDVDYVVLDFHDESVAKRALAVTLDAADLCRKNGSPKPAPESNANGPSLRETLDWLKEKIPLGTVNYVASPVSPNGFTAPISTNVQSVVFSLDSCTGAFGQIVNMASTAVDGSPFRFVGTRRYTVPMGSLIRFSVEHAENIEASRFLSGDRWGYRLGLVSSSKAIHVSASFETFATLLPRVPPIPETSVADTFYMTFSDESTAQRVADAFKHAADLCRGKEPF
jgi:hypothetical protein